MKWNRWARAGFALLAPVLVGGLLIAGEWAQSPASAQSGAKAATAEAATPKAGTASRQTRTDHVRQLQRALITAGYDPGPVDGIFGPRTKAALQQYVAVPPPQVPGPADKTIAQFRTGEQRQGQ
ncbi:MAG TPA: peptidoglycan-binding domain-containing protein [Candidatus Acidoferrales bacterium]|nr:peptidoglycan-binding domain-containing protein [Candidatus Acidoferrales bacterium]